MALAEDHVIDHVLLGDGAAAFGVELVAVGALEHDALAVDGQDAVLDAEAAETDLLGRAFDDVSAWSMTSTSSSYSVGLSALQGAMPCSGPLEIAVCASPRRPSSATP